MNKEEKLPSICCDGMLGDPYMLRSHGVQS